MIDYVKIWLDQLEAYKLKDNPQLEFIPYRDKRNQLRGLKANLSDLTIYHTENGQVKLYGSLHKFNNRGLHNYNDFTAQELAVLTDQINQSLRIRLSDSQLIRFEYGVNIATSIEAKKICEAIVSLGKKKAANTRKIRSTTFTDVDLQQYRLKIYDKGSQYGQGKYLLRFEIHAKKREFYKQFGIKYFGDLLRPEVWPQLKTSLINTFEKLLIIDPTFKKIDRSQLATREVESLNQYLNKTFWHDLINSKDAAAKKRFHYHKKRFEQFGQKLGANTKANLIKSIGEKWDDLTKLQPEKSEQAIGRINSSYIELKRPNVTLHDCITCQLKSKANEERICPVTGLDISMQKEDSFLLSHTGIKHYQKHNKEAFNQLKRTFLSDIWENEPETVQIKELAHNIRNHINNMANRERKKYPEPQTNILSLFNTAPVKYRPKTAI